jgi:multiple sugar transport system permease protein
MNRHARIKQGLSYVLLFIPTVTLAIPLLFFVLNLITNALSGGVWQAYVFTIARCAFYIGVALPVGVIGGYIFSKLRFPGRDRLFLLFLSGMVMPAILMIVPNFVMMARFPLMGGNDILGRGGHGLIGDWRVLFAFGWVPPFAIFLMKQTFDMFPPEYEDAAKMDGAGLFSILFRVYGPLLKPALAAVAITTFLAIWNDYLWPSVTVHTGLEFIPITMRIDAMIGGSLARSSGGNPAALAMLLTLLPPTVVLFWLQRYFVRGLVSIVPKG